MNRLLDPVFFWTDLGTYEDERIVFDRWQVSHMRDYSRIRFREKAPQIGFSWSCAAEAVWECIMFEDSATGFISVDQREAQNKILYARKLYDGLPPVVKNAVPIVRDAMEAIDFGSTNRPSQLLSLPATAGMRGRRMNVVLDESDFYKDGGVSAYRAGIGRIARGGRLTVGSTCFGTDTLLDMNMRGRDDEGLVLKESLKISKGRFPHVVAENPVVIESIQLAKDTLDANDFAEEYECIRGGALTDPFSADLLRHSQHEYPEAEVHVDGNWMRVYPADEGAMMCAGYDVGKGSGRHPSFLSLTQLVGSKWCQIAQYQPQKVNGSALSLPEQLEWLNEMLTRCPNLRIVPDGQGLGAHIAEALVKKFGDRRVIIMIPGSKPKNMKPQDKTEMITELKRSLESEELALMADREQFQQFRRTKRAPGGLYVQAGSSKRAHFDRFWATAYAQYGISLSKHFDSAYRRHGLAVAGGVESRMGGRTDVA